MKRNIRILSVRVLAIACAAVMLLPALPVFASREEKISPRVSDYTGAGTVIAVIEAGFDPQNPAFSVSPAEAKLERSDITRELGRAYASAYVSEKIPLALDYCADGVDTDLTNLTDTGTQIASVAAGHYLGAGDTLTEDGKVMHESDFAGIAPDAQLLLMKAAEDSDDTITAEAASAAIRDAIALGADVILTNFTRMEAGDTLRAAFAEADRANIPIYGGAGEPSAAVRAMLQGAPAAFVDRGTLTEISAYPSAVTAAAAKDPYAHILSFTAGGIPVYYTDSSLTYLGYSMGQAFAGQTVKIVRVPNFGEAADYESLDVRGAIAVVMRGGISFSEKAKYAAEAGALGMIVADNGSGVAQMALTDSPIPAVMVNEADGAYLTGGDAPDTVTFEEKKEGIAPFSASGTTADFKGTVAFAAVGQNVLTAGDDGYAYRSGTQYAAARAAGYCARAAEYLHALGKSGDAATAILTAAARPFGESLHPLRTAGAGLLDDACVFPRAVITAAYGEAVSVTALETDSSSVRVRITLTNLTSELKKYTLRADFAADEIGEDGRLTGASVPVTGVRCTTGLLTRDITKSPKTVLVGARRSVSVTLSVSMQIGTLSALQKKMPHGFFLDGRITATGGADSTSFPITVFWGDTEKLPLSDASAFDGGAVLAPVTLAVRMPEATAYTIGTADRTAAVRTYDDAYSILSPVHLRGGELIAYLTPLREIDTIRVRVTDTDGHLLYEDDKGGAARYLTVGTQTAVPLWDFTAADNPEYVFPDGAYTVDVICRSGSHEQTLTFTVHADSTAPSVSDLTVTKTEDGYRICAEAADETALGTVSVYDRSGTYAYAFVSGKTHSIEAEIPSDITSPIYIEVTDYAGGYKVLRLTKTDLAKAAEGGK